MYDYVIIHGSYGNPFENWFPWLFQQLTDEGKSVLAPQFPCGENIQNYDNWEKVLDSYADLIDENTTFIGHSLSPAFIVDYLIKHNKKVKDLIFAAPFYGLINIPDFDAVNSPFFILEDLSKISSLSERRISFISKNDPYVPNELSIDFVNKISSETIFVEEAGHFNTAAGYSKFEQLKQML